jgi:multisubunit Na+/H+ antiporter MnhB subunit
MVGEPDGAFPLGVAPGVALGVALLALPVAILKELEQVEAWIKMEQ